MSALESDAHDEAGENIQLPPLLSTSRRGRPLGDRAGPVHPQLMQTWVFQHEVLGWDAQYIAQCSQTFTQKICKATVLRALKRFEETGLVDHPPRIRREHNLSDQHKAALKGIIEKEPYLFLEEIASAFNAATGLRYSRDRVHGALIAAGFSLKVMQAIRAGRDEALRQGYWKWVIDFVWDPSWLVFADETSLDGRALRRRKGWGKVGSRVTTVHVFHRGQRISILALYTHSGQIEFEFVVGSYDAQNFMVHITTLIQKVMKPLPGPDSVLVLDNCRIHHVYEDELREACAHKGGILQFLAPYSPIDNPIEKEFNSFKARWKKHGAFLQAMDTRPAIRRCFDMGCSASAAANYASCGYDVIDRMWR